MAADLGKEAGLQARTIQRQIMFHGHWNDCEPSATATTAPTLSPTTNGDGAHGDALSAASTVGGTVGEAGVEAAVEAKAGAGVGRVDGRPPLQVDGRPALAARGVQEFTETLGLFGRSPAASPAHPSAPRAARRHEAS